GARAPSVLFENPAFSALPVLFLFGAPLVVLLLAGSYGDLDFHFTLFPVYGGRDYRLPLALDQADQAVDFAPMQQQAAGAHRVRCDMGGYRRQRRDQAAEQEGLAV